MWCSAVGVVLTLIGAVCAPRSAFAKCPEWTRSRSASGFPTERYVVGLGVVGNVWQEARGAEPGKAAALSDIANQLTVRVTSELKVSTWQTTQGGSGTAVKESSGLQSDLVLRGARVVKNCFDGETATYYTLAVLDRAEAAAKCVEDARAANERGASALQLVSAALTAGDGLGALSNLPAVLSAAADAERLATAIRALDASTAQPFTTVAEVWSLIRKAKALTPVKVDSDDATGTLSSELVRQLSKVGVPITPSTNPNASLTVFAHTETIDVGVSRTGATIVRVRAQIEIRDAASVVLASVVRESTGGAANRELATQRALLAVARDAGDQVTHTVTTLTHVAELAKAD